MAAMELNDSMTANEQGVKRVSLRWSESFWEAVSIEATKRRTSIQAIATEAVAAYLGIPLVDKQQDSTAA